VAAVTSWLKHISAKNNKKEWTKSSYQEQKCIVNSKLSGKSTKQAWEKTMKQLLETETAMASSFLKCIRFAMAIKDFNNKEIFFRRGNHLRTMK